MGEGLARQLRKLGEMAANFSSEDPSMTWLLPLKRGNPSFHLSAEDFASREVQNGVTPAGVFSKAWLPITSGCAACDLIYDELPGLQLSDYRVQ